MKPIQLSVTGNVLSVTAKPVLTAGTVGLPVEITFDEAWEDLEKTAVFRANGKTLDSIHIQSRTVVPWELLTAPGCRFYVGIYGTNSDGSLQIPTIWGDLGVIQPGADPAGDESAIPGLPVWQQLSNQVEQALEEIIDYQNRIISGEIIPTQAGDDHEG